MQQPVPIRRLDNRGKNLRIARGRVAGFTLIELLVAMSILLILATITIRLVNTTLDSDRMKSGSRELQSYLAGARDRAIYAGQPRGVRFIPDQTDPYTVRSFVYIGASSNYTDNQLIDIQTTPVVTLAGTIVPENAQTLTNWQALWARGVLTNGTQIQLTQGSVNIGFLTIAATTFTGNQPTQFAITSTTSTAGLTLPAIGCKYTLQLAPAILPSEQPRSLPRNIVIDLRTSIVPKEWPAPTASSTFDVLFSPAGTVTGPVASDGRIHFVLADIADTTGAIQIGSLTTPSLLRFQLNAPWQATTAYQPGNVVVPTPSSFIAFRCTQVTGTGGTGLSGGTAPTWPTQPNQTVTDNQVTWQSFVKKANSIVSLATATGRVTTHPVDVSPNDILTSGTVSGYDSFKFAEIGEVTQ
jgi:prepilin-type N-terminal cleavage/methylation domain-containing protein